MLTLTCVAAVLLHLILVAGGQHVDAEKSTAHKDSRKLLNFPVTRTKRTTDHIVSECFSVTGLDGHYFYKSSSDEDTVCGVYLFTDPDRTVEIYFNYLDVPCEDGGLVSFVDGWELSGQIFPSESDHQKPMQSRFSEFCGKRKPKRVFKSSQNAALIQYRVPRRGAGFSFSVRFPQNRSPCNVLLPSQAEVHTLRNYGKRVNCTISAVFPAVAQILSVSVGIVGGRNVLEMETGTIYKCQKRGLEDYVQIGGSSGLDTSTLYVTESICGIDSKPGKDYAIFCGVTTVRLVSSGAYDNAVTVSLREADKDTDVSLAATVCPSEEF